MSGLNGKAIDDAIAEAHLPTLVMSIVHLTGDTSILQAERPVYGLFDERQRTYSDAAKTLIRQRARAAIIDYANGRPLPPPPDSTVVQQMMNYIAGADIPERYIPFLMEELMLDGVDPNTPQWTEPALRTSASGMFVVVIGAGLSGILAGVRLQQAGIPFVIIEKNKDVGGTWFENTYPGCRVDSTNHMYAYSFAATGHAWPMWYSTQPTLLGYFGKVADQHELREHIRFETTLVEAVYDEKRTVWTVRLRARDGAESTIEATAVMTAVGQLNQLRLPDIKGLDTFAGDAFHSASWRHDVDLSGKRVAVIGTGASAFQIIPAIAPQVGKLSVFQRSAPWIMPTKNYHDRVGSGFQWLLDNVPFYEKWWRFFLFWSFTDGVYDAVRLDENGAPNAQNTRIRELLSRQMRQQLEGAEHLADKVIPDMPFGSKRALRDNGSWIKTLRRDNVDLVTDNIAEINSAGIRTTDGKQHDVDVIVFGTGFRATEFLKEVNIVGRGGCVLSEFWDGDAKAYLGMMVPNFPNFFMLYGPNTNIVVNGSIIMFSECAIQYVLSCLRLLAERGADSLEIRPDVFEAFNEAVDERNANMAWGAPDATNWYKNAAGRVSQNWPFPIVDYWYATREAQADDLILYGEKA
ncbi:MAG: NAD(P)/FAD-dependent oxidoreductase [Pseudomonadota bacterium]